jgi:hypothetical protein
VSSVAHQTLPPYYIPPAAPGVLRSREIAYRQTGLPSHLQERFSPEHTLEAARYGGRSTPWGTYLLAALLVGLYVKRGNP